MAEKAATRVNCHIFACFGMLKWSDQKANQDAHFDQFSGTSVDK